MPVIKYAGKSNEKILHNQQLRRKLAPSIIKDQ